MTLLLQFAQEATEVHTRILRLSLGADESRSYWANVDPRVPLADRPDVAIARGWFPGKSAARVRYLVASCAERYDAYPDGLEALRRWRTIDAASTRIVAHVHLMLSDPLYRAFAADLLLARRRGAGPLDRDVVEAFIERQAPARWSTATTQQAAQKLLAAAHEAGLLSARDPREHHTPPVPDLALAYVLYLLRGVKIAGGLLDNTYLLSLGLVGESLDHRLAGLGALGVRRAAAGGVIFTDPDVVAWARHTFAPVVG